MRDNIGEITQVFIASFEFFGIFLEALFRLYTLGYLTQMIGDTVYEYPFLHKERAFVKLRHLFQVTDFYFPDLFAMDLKIRRLYPFGFNKIGCLVTFIVNAYPCRCYFGMPPGKGKVRHHLFHYVFRGIPVLLGKAGKIVKTVELLHPFGKIPFFFSEGIRQERKKERYQVIHH